ncbi:hypothetical protein B0H10DRAFT_1956402 [Mycena sp. CBHHK59/15]|nr:hypothetical protein B0H10DRAFT_1956402 [Mycena sp. CBHHK59/15]
MLWCCPLCIHTTLHCVCLVHPTLLASSYSVVFLHFASMKQFRGHKLERPSKTEPTTARLATCVPTFKINYHTECGSHEQTQGGGSCIHGILLSLHYSSQLHTPCACGKAGPDGVQTVTCSKCLQAELLCPQCWLNKHRTMPTHWVFVWNAKECFFEKHNFCRVRKNTVIGPGHHGERCPDPHLGQSFTLVDRNRIHATEISFCGCKTADGKRGAPQFQQLLWAGIFPSVLDVDEPELTAIQLPSYRMKHGQRRTTGVDANNLDSQLREAEIKLQCMEADSGILAVRAASLALSAVKKAWDLDYRGQAGITCLQRNLQKAELTKTFEITMYNNVRAALIHLGHMEKDDVEPYQPLTYRDMCRKETHLHRVKGDSQLFDGMAWYLQSGVTISRTALSPGNREQDSKDDEPQLLAGTQTLKRSGFKHSQCTPKHLKDIAPDDVDVESSSSASEAEDSDLEMSPSKQPKGGSMTRGQSLGNAKLAEYKKESNRVQWFRAEAEMYRWLEQYKRKHAELMRVIERFHRDSVVWAGLADREEQRNGV